MYDRFCSAIKNLHKGQKDVGDNQQREERSGDFEYPEAVRVDVFPYYRVSLKGYPVFHEKPRYHKIG